MIEATLNVPAQVDVVAASLGDRYIVWFDRRLETEDAWDIVVVGDGVNGPYDTQPMDFDGDGDVDVVCATTNDDRLAWYENLHGEGKFWHLHVITTQAASVHAMCVADIDDDGDLDILSANFAADAVVWYEQDVDDHGHATWSEGATIEAGVDGATAIAGVDMDGDGDLDVVATSLTQASGDNVAWHDLNLVPAPTPAPTITFRPTSVPSSAPTIFPSIAPTIEDPLKPTARPTHRPSPVPTPKPTTFTLTWEDLVREYRLYIAGMIIGILTCCCCHCFCKAIKPIIIMLEPLYMPTVTHLHKKWLRSDTRRVICYPCPEVCRGKEPEDPLSPFDAVELKGEYDIPVRIVYDEPRRKGKTELIQTAPREITFVQRFEFYSCYS